jgi:outer membrane lipoprotein SlyB
VGLTVNKENKHAQPFHHRRPAAGRPGLLSAGANPKEQFNAENKRIATRYADDKNSAAKKDPASACNACATPRPNSTNQPPWPRPSTKPARPSQAPAMTARKVTQVVVGEKAGEGSALGVIAGGVAGALLGNQVGSGHGRQLATVAGAAGGAYAGKKIEEKAKSSKQWTVHVQYDDGRQASFHFDHDPQMMSGDQNANGSIVRR